MMSGQPVAAPDEAGELKINPAALELRGRPPRAVRFRRGLLIGAAALGAAGLAATVWFSLRPQSARTVEAGDRYVPAKGVADAVRALPSDYAAVPKLGPPLPGDLGRPILERQRQLAEGGLRENAPAREAAGARRVNMVEAARQSGLLFRQPSPASPGVTGAADPSGGKMSEDPAPMRIDSVGDPNGQSRKIGFARDTDDLPDVNPHRLAAPASPYLLSAGSVIAASLITGLRSDLPGLVVAQVSENVFDSATGRFLLIPQGARLIGAYDSVVAFGQKRALVIWQRIVLPDGSSIRLDNEPASDPGGYAGVADKVDFHTWALLKGVGISTLLGAGTNVSLTGESDLVRAIRESTQQNAANAGNQIAARNLDIQPTITVRPGCRIRLLVHRDLVLAPWRP